MCHSREKKPGLKFTTGDKKRPDPDTLGVVNDSTEIGLAGVLEKKIIVMETVVKNPFIQRERK